MVEKYLMESYKSFQKCRLANSVRRNSLVKKTHAIEAERKLVCDRMDREERLFKEHARNIQMEHTRTCTCRTAKERTLCAAAASSRISTSGVVDTIDPYPVTFARKAASKMSNRKKCTTNETIKDFKTGSENGYRGTKDLEERCISGKVTASGHQAHPGLVSSVSWTGRGQGATGNAKNAQEPLDESILWVGDPEAIHSVRRARKSVAQQDMERYHRMREN